MSDLLPVKTSVSPSATPMPAADYAAMQGDEDFGGGSANPIRIKRLLLFLKRYWWLPLITLTISLAAGYLYVRSMPPVYVSRGVMWETEKMRLSDGAAFVSDLQNYYGTQMELLQGDFLKERVLTRLKTSRPGSVPRGPDNKDLPVKVEVRQKPKSTIFYIEASSGNPAYSQAFLDALMGEFLVYKKEVRDRVSGDTWNQINEETKRRERELQDDKAAYTEFQKTNNLAILQEEGTMFGGYLARLKTQLSDLLLEQRLLDATALEQESALSNTNTPPRLPSFIRWLRHLRPRTLRLRQLRPAFDRSPGRLQRTRIAEARARPSPQIPQGQTSQNCTARFRNRAWL